MDEQDRQDLDTLSEVLTRLLRALLKKGIITHEDLRVVDLDEFKEDIKKES